MDPSIQAALVVLTVFLVLVVSYILASTAKATILEGQRNRAALRAREQEFRLAQQKHEHARQRAAENEREATMVQERLRLETRLTQAQTAYEKAKEATASATLRIGDREVDTRSGDAIFSALSPLLEQARFAFIRAQTSCRRFRRRLQRSVEPALEGFDQFVAAVEKAQTPDIRVYQQLHNPTTWQRLKSRGEQPTDELIHSLFAIAKFFTSAEDITASLNAQDQLRFFSDSMDAGILIHDALLYQLIEFQGTIVQEHTRFNEPALAAESGHRLLENLYNEYKADTSDDELKSESEVLAKLTRQRVEILAGIVRQSKDLVDSAVKGGEDITTLSLELGSQFTLLINSRREIAKARRSSKDPIKIIATLRRLGPDMETALVPGVASTFGYTVRARAVPPPRIVQAENA